MIKNCEHFFFHVCLSGKGVIEWLRLIRLARPNSFAEPHPSQGAIFINNGVLNCTEYMEYEK